jgi:flagellar hook-associated protein 1 FlgK
MENLKITGHDIANADTVGYTRQRLITSAKEAANSVYLIRPTVDSSIARGVEVLSIQQLRSAYLDNQYRDLNSGFAYSAATVQSLTYLQGLFNPELEKGKGSDRIHRTVFFSSLNTFATDTTTRKTESRYRNRPSA